MANNSIFQYEQPRLPDNWNEQERRFFNRVIEIFDDIYSRFRNISMTQVIKQVLDTEIRTNGSATTLSVYSLAATFAKMTQLSAKVGTFDFETVQNLVSSALAVEQLSGGDVSINNLYVRYAQIGKAILESVCVKCSEDGKYYTLEFHADGTTTATEAEVTQQEIDDGWTRNAQRIVALEITAAELNAGSLKASEAIMDSITASRIDVATLIARESFITTLFAAEAFIELLSTTAIVGDKSISLIAEESGSAKTNVDNMGRVFQVKPDGVHIYYGTKIGNNIQIDENAPNVFIPNDGLGIAVPTYSPPDNVQPSGDDIYRWVTTSSAGAFGDLKIYTAQHCVNLKARTPGERFFAQRGGE